MLELDVRPGQSLGTQKYEFVLGMHFSQSIAILQQQASLIRGVQVIYNQINPLESDFVLHLSQDGIKLIFEPLSQRLKLIHVVNMRLVKLTYNNIVFNAPEKPPTRLVIDDAFGATHPESFCHEDQEFVLTFPGLSFRLPGDPKQIGSQTKAQQIRVSSLQIYCGKGLSHAYVPHLPPQPGHFYLDTLTVDRDQNVTRGIKLSLVLEVGGRNNSQQKQINKTINFGASCQSVLSAIGAPNRIFYKSEDKMKIHNIRRNMRILHSDYFFNYFNLGFDILFDARSHSAKKFVLHTNFPGHHNFNMYQRCNFELPLILKPSTSTRDAAQLIDLPEVVTVTPASKWETVNRRLATRGPPVVLRKTSSSGGYGGNTAPTSNIHLTNCYNHQDIIIEVMQNQHIAAVTLFRSTSEAA